MRSITQRGLKPQVAMALIVALLVAGCGGTSETDTAPEPNIGPAALPGGGPAVAPEGADAAGPAQGQ